MALEDTDSIDIIYRSQEGKPVLVIADAGVTVSPEKRFELLLDKLKSYVNAIMIGSLRKDFPAAEPRDYTIEYLYQNEPTEQMRLVTHVTPHGDRKNMISVVFRAFR